MIGIKILLGLLGLGIVVLVHETGHFIAARLMGIGVEAFSIGWGKALLKKKIGEVEYRLSLFPLGGYCKMRGENEFQEAYEKQLAQVPQVPGTYYGVKPWRRMVVCVAGPLFNLLFAILVFSIIWGIGFQIETLGNRIVLVSDVNPGETYPADQGGLKTGDRILRIDGRPINYYHEIQEAIAPNAEVPLGITVERDGRPLELTIRPLLDKSAGAGKLGVYFWADPIIASLTPGGRGEAAGLRPGDRIVKANGEDFPYTAKLYAILRDSPGTLNLEYEREGSLHTAEIPLSYGNNNDPALGIVYKTISYHTPRYSFIGAIAKGAGETWKTLVISIRSLSLLFRGIDLTQAVSGPVRITYMVGDVAAAGFGESFGEGMSSMASFLALISIALCIMNLLPLPILDGGMILLFILETLKGNPLRPKAVYVFQTVGAVLIGGLTILAIFGDILFLIRR